MAVRPTATNQGFKSLVPRPGVASEFLYYKILTLKDELASYGTGSTFLEVSKRDVAGLRLEVPDYDEQRAIATVLGDVDDGIDALRSNLEKAKGIRQGMMQELLTGRTRLSVKEPEA
jgi:type I restriction enzyme S subunit